MEAMTSKIILIMPKIQELSKFQRIKSKKASRIKSRRIKIQEQLSFKIQDSRTIKIKIQDSRFKIQEKLISRFKRRNREATVKTSQGKYFSKIQT